jgi:hypothetical protein
VPTVEDGVLLDRALAGASKRRPEYWRQPGRRSLGRGGGRGEGVHAGGGQGVEVSVRWADGGRAGRGGTDLSRVRERGRARDIFWIR